MDYKKSTSFILTFIKQRRTPLMEPIRSNQQEPNKKKRKRQDAEITEQIEKKETSQCVLIVSLKEEPNFLYVPVNEFKKHKKLLHSLALMDLEDDELENLEKEWNGLFGEWYNEYFDDSSIVNLKKKNIIVVKVIKLVDY